ncbi:GNAT family N-acetyltransferase [Kribbella sp. NPDC056345]|uniref:GNAT family N-acetyltransferase n=1 Tax=Kribbella sp. NPDC056345 TaxID=3345789 RepID=UPI0035D5AD81
MTVIVRPARVDDADAMARVFVDSFRAGHQGQVPADVLQSRTYESSAAAWRRDLTTPSPGEYISVAASGGELVGVAMVGPPHPWPDDDTARSEVPTAECWALYVDPSHQRKGIGRLLIADFSRHLADRGTRRLLVGVLTANAPARAFYESLGAVLIGSRPHLDEGQTFSESVYAWPDLPTLGL